MTQLLLPIFPPGHRLINNQIGFKKEEGKIYYFHGLLPVFSHEEEDIESFRFITSQLVLSGNVRQIEIVKAFGVSYISVKRSVKRLREKGSKGFFDNTRAPRSGHVLTEDVLVKAQCLLDEGLTVSEVAKKLEIKADTVRKAIVAGRLRKKKV